MKKTTTVLVEISEADLINFTTIDNMELEKIDEKGYDVLFKSLPFTLYQGRNKKDNIKLQVSLNRFILFKSFGLVL